MSIKISKQEAKQKKDRLALKITGVITIIWASFSIVELGYIGAGGGLLLFLLPLAVIMLGVIVYAIVRLIIEFSDPSLKGAHRRGMMRRLLIVFCLTVVPVALYSLVTYLMD